MAGLHTKKTVILAYTATFIGIIGCILIKEHTRSAQTAADIATEIDVPRTLEQVLEEKYAETPLAQTVPAEVITQADGIYQIHTKQGLQDFVTDVSKQDKPIVVKFANNRACDPCKALRPTYLLNAKFLGGKAYFAEIDENEFDDLDYFAELAPIIPAFTIYKNGMPVRSFQGLKSRTHLRDELAAVS